MLNFIQYEIGVENKNEHLFSVAMCIYVKPNQSSENSVTLALPSWIPGSYMIRDFARNLHSLNCENKNIALSQLDKQHWEVRCSESIWPEQLVFTYQIYANDLSVRSAFINDEYAFFNGTSVFLCVKEHMRCEHKVTILSDGMLSGSSLPNSKLDSHSLQTSQVITGMPKLANNNFGCDNYYDLIDYPVIIGSVTDYCFDVSGYKFHLVFTGQDSIDCPRLEHDLTPIIEHHINLFGSLPCNEYWFMTLVCHNGFGGLEHLNSTVLQYARFSLPMLGDEDAHTEKKSKPYQQFLSLCSHELFHTWHVKRIKPEVFHQPNLFEEVYTPQLWIYEGFTSLYDDLSLARAKVITASEYADILSETITRYLRTPGRHKQSAATSSFEAWTKFYKQDAGSLNHIVSYYNKGAVIALCLDITIRQLSNNEYNLDNLMQLLWQHYGVKNIGTPNNVVEVLCRNEFNIDISSFLHVATQTSFDMPLHQLLSFIGLKMNMRPSNSLQDKGGKSVSDFNIDIGANISQSGDYLLINSVQHQRSASQAGLMVGDKIIAVDKLACTEVSFTRLLKQKKNGQSIQLHIMRDGRLIELVFPIEQAIEDSCELIIEDAARFNLWLGG